MGGLVALGLLVIAESAGVRWVRGLTVSDYLNTFTPVSGGAALVMFLLFAAMPTLLARSLGARRRRQKVTS